MDSGASIALYEVLVLTSGSLNRPAGSSRLGSSLIPQHLFDDFWILCRCLRRNVLRFTKVLLTWFTLRLQSPPRCNSVVNLYEVYLVVKVVFCRHTPPVLHFVPYLGFFYCLHSFVYIVLNHRRYNRYRDLVQIYRLSIFILLPCSKPEKNRRTGTNIYLY